MRNVIDIMIVCCFSTGFIFDFLGRIHDELFFAVGFDVREDVIVFRIVKRIGIMVFPASADAWEMYCSFRKDPCLSQTRFFTVK